MRKGRRPRPREREGGEAAAKGAPELGREVVWTPSNGILPALKHRELLPPERRDSHTFSRELEAIRPGQRVPWPRRRLSGAGREAKLPAAQNETALRPGHAILLRRPRPSMVGAHNPGQPLEVER
jgi:hypothetical protein